MTMTKKERERERHRKYYQEHQEKQTERHRKYYLANREKVLKRSSEYAKAHPEKAKARQKRYRERMFGVKYPDKTDCEICERKISEETICLDHNYNTGKFRGWLCNNCNVNLGWLERRLEKVLEYLER